MTAALLTIAPRINYRALFVACFIVAYPLWHAEFPTVAVAHVDVVPPSESAATPAEASMPPVWVRHCRG